MSSHTCPRCGAVTDPVLPGGLCGTCHGRADDTRQAVSVVADAPTPSFDPDVAGTLTFATPADTTVTHGEAGADPFGVLPAGGYVYGEVLGTGGMGCVYKAVRVSTGQTVAIKKLRPERYTPSLLQRFVLEARILSRVDHPNVVRLHDFVPDPGDPHIVMDFVDGCSLADRLADGKGVPADLAARLTADAARGVAAAHAAGGIHRDLKPGNLLVTKADQIKVSDFGLGKVIADDGDSPTLTATDSPIGGTPGYAAPEQVAEGGECDERTDVWGLGACLHAALTGRPPYPTGRANLTRVLSDPLVPPRAFNRHVPPVLDAIVCKCLEKDPARRYQSA
ncbi:MAG: serine/threonine-protein kinase, partial [Gemmataceae bacterium]